ncbi:MAG: class I SAM-dependent methyltransferase [Pseudomonadota bacterium]
MSGDGAWAAKWDARYRAAPAEGLFGGAPNAYLRAVAERPELKLRSALFLADGDGRNSRWLAARGVACAAVDLSAEATRRAAASDAAAGVSVERICADLERWTPPAERWDAAFLIYLQGPPALRAAAMDAAWRGLAPGGWFGLEAFAVQAFAAEAVAAEDFAEEAFAEDALAVEAVAGPRAADADRLGPEAAARYRCDEVIAALPGAEIIEAMTGLVRLDEGPRHQGLAAALRILARKPAKGRAAPPQ